MKRPGAAAWLSLGLLILISCQANPAAMATRKTEPLSPSPQAAQSPVSPSPGPASPPAPLRTTALTTAVSRQGSWRNFYTPDFTAVHKPLDSQDNEFLIFGNLPVMPPPEGLPRELAAFLGRWEGKEIGPYGETGNQAVLLVTQIGIQEGKAYLWAGADLQYPFFTKEIDFRVVPGKSPAIGWEADLTGAPGGKGVRAIVTFSHEGPPDRLAGSLRALDSGDEISSIELARGEKFHYFRNFAAYLEGKDIGFHAYREAALRRIGQGYLLYLPAGYASQVDQSWPLIVFLIGTGERGSSPSLLVKHGPLRDILDGDSLPFIIASPMLEVSPDFRSFPEKYLDGLMDELLADYAVDRGRIYLTGLSMGGEATYRYALHRPELFAALAPLAAFDPRYLPGSTEEGFQPFTRPWTRLKEIPVWAVHGRADPVVPLFAAQKTVDALRAAGGQVRFDIVAGGGHNIWSAFYSDPDFYQWLLAQHK